jgi:membrane protein
VELQCRHESAIFDALNIIYDEDEKRGLIWLNVVSLFFTVCAPLPPSAWRSRW